MIGFYIYSSHREAGAMLQVQLWGDGGIEKRIEGRLDWRKYGTELREILIGVYAEGAISVDAPNGVRVGKVSKKDKSLRLDFAVEPHILISMPVATARGYLVLLITMALRAPLSKRKWDFDFDRLASDFQLLLEVGGGDN